MVAQDESGEIEVTEGGTSCGSFDVRVGTSRPAASCVGLLPSSALDTPAPRRLPTFTIWVHFPRSGCLILSQSAQTYLRALSHTSE